MFFVGVIAANGIALIGVSLSLAFSLPGHLLVLMQRQSVAAPLL
jgi:hypothetical protein